MDREVVEQKLESLRRCVRRLKDRCPSDIEVLTTDLDAQDIVVLNLTRAVQVSVDLASHALVNLGESAPDTMGETFRVLARAGVISADLAERLRAAVGFRNLAVHTYRAIDWQIVHRIVRERLGDFEAFALAIAARPGQ